MAASHVFGMPNIVSGRGLNEKLNVAGRFDDTDIVHAIAENLQIQSQVGGVLGTITGGILGFYFGKESGS